MSRLLSLCLFIVMALTPVPTLAQTVFYQPSVSDRALTEAQWRETWRQLSESGIRQVIVQWTRYDNEEFGGQDGWLQRALQSAEQQNLDLVLGLSFQSDYRSVLVQQDRPHYFWHHLLSDARLQQERLLEWGLQPQAWYLPYSLDDGLYRSAELMREIDYQLKAFYALDKRPLHISAQSTGQLAPRVYAEWLGLLGSEQVQIWWHSGAELPAVVKQAYQVLLPCRVGIVEPEADVSDCHPQARLLRP